MPAGGIEVVAFGLGDSALRGRYDRLHGSCPRAYIQQSTTWAEIIAPLGPDQPMFLLATDESGDLGGLPLYLFDAVPGKILTSVPQPGPLGGVFGRSTADASGVYRALLNAADSVARQNDCLALTIISNPLADDRPLYRRFLAPDLEFENFTQIVPVERAVSEGIFILPNNRERNPGRTLRKAHAFGFRTELCEDPETFSRWYEIHTRRHGELGLAPLARPLLCGLWRRLAPQGKAFLLVVRAGDEIASGCLFVQHRDICDAFILSTNMAFSKQAPNYLLLEQALLLMAKRGVRWMNWQSSPKRNDGVYKFKAQWGSVERTYSFLTKVYGNSDRILKIGAAGARRNYPNHYLIPFEAFATGSLQGQFRKP